MALAAAGVMERVSVQKGVWLLARPYENLKADEGRDLQEVCQASQELAALHPLAQSFGQIVRKREGHRLQGWMKQVEASSFRDVKRFVEAIATRQRRSPCRLNTGLIQWAGGRPDQQAQTAEANDVWQGRVSKARVNVCFMRCSYHAIGTPSEDLGR